MWLEEQGQPSAHPQSQFVGTRERSAVQFGVLAQGCSWTAGSEDEFLPYYHPYTYNVGLFVGFWFGWLFLPIINAQPFSLLEISGRCCKCQNK